MQNLLNSDEENLLLKQKIFNPVNGDLFVNGDLTVGVAKNETLVFVNFSVGGRCQPNLM